MIRVQTERQSVTEPAVAPVKARPRLPRPVASGYA